MTRLRAGVAAGLAALAASLLLLVPAAGAASAAEQDRDGPELDARAWMLVDSRSGTPLASRAAARRLPVASATKLMTAFVALEELPLDRRVPMAPYDAIPAESLLEVPAGEMVSVRDLLYGLILRSGNDAANTLAVAAAGSVKRFVGKMNRHAAALGLADTHYANPIGLDQRGNYSSARDLATLTRRLLRNRAFARIADAREAELRSLRPPRTISSRNELLYMAPWANGVKTGHTLGAGYVLVGSGSRRAVELIAVTIGSPTDAARYAANLELLEYGFGRYRRRAPVRTGQELAAVAIRYSGGSLPLRAGRTVAVGVRPGQRLRTEVRAPAEVEGPIRRGAGLGRVTVFVDGIRVGGARLRAGRAIPAASDFDRARAFVGDNPITIAVAGFVILMVGVLLYRRLSRRNDRGSGTG